MFALAFRRVALCAAVSLAGFTGSFAQDEAPAASAIDLSGCWSGEWESCTTGHHGPLSATFCRIDETRYRVEFRGRYFKTLPFKYSVVLRVVEESEDSVTLAGSAYLSRRYGTFTYRATATDCCFICQYDSCKDDGTFRLHRCTRPCCSD